MADMDSKDYMDNISDLRHILPYAMYCLGTIPIPYSMASGLGCALCKVIIFSSPSANLLLDAPVFGLKTAVRNNKHVFI